GIAAVHAGFAAAIALAQLLDAVGPLAEPELALRCTAGENDMCKLLDFATNRCICRLPHPAGAVSGSASDGDQDVLLCPVILLEDLAKRLEADLHLRRAKLERRPVIDERWVGLPAKPHQFFARAVKPLLVSVEVEPLEDALNLGNVIWILGADEQVDIHESGLGGDVQAQLDVGKEQLNVGEPASGLMS